MDSFAETKRIVSLVSLRAMAPLGLGFAQVALLREVGRSGSATQATLARATVCDPSAAARALTVLDRRGLVRRRRSEIDRRESYVELTGVGRRFLRRVEAIQTQTATLLAARLDTRDVAVLERISTKLAPLAEESEPKPRTRRRKSR